MKKMRQTLLGLAVMCLIIGFGCATSVFADSYSDPVNVSIPYTQTYADNGTRTDTFTYQLKPLEGAPAAVESNSNGVYTFSIKAKPKSVAVKGNVKASFVFPNPGKYDYEVKATGPKGEGITLDKNAYTLHVYVKNASGGGLTADEVIITAKGSTNKKDGFTFNPKYTVPAQAVTRPISTPDDDDTSAPAPRRAAAANNAPAAAAPAAPADNPAPAEPDPPTANIGDPVGPQAAPDEPGVWALLNLLLAIANVLGAIILAARYFGRIDTDEDEYVIRREGKWRLAGIVLAVVSVVAFLLTETIPGNRMVLTDEWTPFMAIVFALMVVLCIFVHRHYNAGNGEQTAGA